jgi:hypothetical protein
MFTDQADNDLITHSVSKHSSAEKFSGNKNTLSGDHKKYLPISNINPLNKS